MRLVAATPDSADAIKLSLPEEQSFGHLFTSCDLIGYWLFLGPLTAVFITELAYHQNKAACREVQVFTVRSLLHRDGCQGDVGRVLMASAALCDLHFLIYCHFVSKSLWNFWTDMTYQCLCFHISATVHSIPGYWCHTGCPLSQLFFSLWATFQLLPESLHKKPCSHDGRNCPSQGAKGCNLWTFPFLSLILGTKKIPR